jgi:hypothetical protein
MPSDARRSSDLSPPVAAGGFAAAVQAESEGGGSVLYWKQGHWAFFENYCKAHGHEMTENTLMAFEYFELIDPDRARAPLDRRC